jgi:Uma2 family endonuclease
MLLIEVSDTTLRYDQRVKVPLYARNGIPEVWVVDLGGRAIYVYREPTSTGYRVVLVRRAGERVGPSALPEFEIPVESILPPIGGSGG